MKRTIFGDSTVVASKEQVSCDLAGESAILNLRNGMYYGLDALGARIWDLIQEPKTVNDVRDVILVEYEVEPTRCERELLRLLRKLGDEGLIEVRDETAA